MKIKLSYQITNTKIIQWVAIYKLKFGYFVKKPEDIACKFLNELVQGGTSSKFLNVANEDYEMEGAEAIINAIPEGELEEAFKAEAKLIIVRCGLE